MWGNQGGRTSQAALPDATLSKQNQTSAWMLHVMGCLGREEVFLRKGGDGGGRVGADTPAPRTTTLNSRLRMRCVSITHLVSHPMRVPGGDLGGARDGSGLVGSAGSDGKLGPGKIKLKKGGSSHQGW